MWLNFVNLTTGVNLVLILVTGGTPRHPYPSPFLCQKELGKFQCRHDVRASVEPCISYDLCLLPLYLTLLH